jgi:isopenicillin N synthase-like dioxygenase
MQPPLIDLSAPADDALAAQIDNALRHSGFFTVVGHGVPPALRRAAFAASRAFFALPQADKERWHISGWPVKRGYDPIGWQSLDVGQPPDVKESFYIGEAAHGPNQWPDEARVPGFRPATEAWQAALHGVALRLMALFEQALGLPARYFDAFMHQPIHTLRLLHYPPQPDEGEGGAAPGQIGCGAHTDWGALTLLAQDDAGGLQVQLPDGGWCDVAPHDDAFVVNAGDLLQRWTNDRWRSTPHRVINRGRPGMPPRDRWSMAYFFDLDPHVRIEPLPGCVSAGQPARYGATTPAEHLAEMYRRTTVAAA